MENLYSYLFECRSRASVIFILRVSSAVLTCAAYFFTFVQDNMLAEERHIVNLIKQ